MNAQAIFLRADRYFPILGSNSRLLCPRSTSIRSCDAYPWLSPTPAASAREALPRRGLASQARKKGPHMPGDAQTAYLFQCDGEDLFAVSPDKGGANIPRSTCTQGWLLRQEFQLGAHAPVPAPCEPEPAMRGIHARGYYIWRVGNR